MDLLKIIGIIGSIITAYQIIIFTIRGFTRSNYWTNGRKRFSKWKLALLMPSDIWSLYDLLRTNSGKYLGQILCPNEWENYKYWIETYKASNMGLKLSKEKESGFKKLNDALNKKLGEKGKENINYLLIKELVEDHERVPGRSLIKIILKDRIINY